MRIQLKQWNKEIRYRKGLIKEEKEEKQNNGESVVEDKPSCSIP